MPDASRDSLRTQPWLAFTLELHALQYRTWLLLGETESKCADIAGAALEPEAESDLHALYLSKRIADNEAGIPMLAAGLLLVVALLLRPLLSRRLKR